MHLSIISPEKELYNGETILVQFPGTHGSFEVLPGHAKMVVTITAGEIRIVINRSQTRKITVKGGIVEVKDDHILVLAN